MLTPTSTDDERPSSRKTVDNENRDQSTYLRACKKYKTAPSTMVLRRIGEKTLNLRHHNLGPRGEVKLNQTEH